MRRALVLACTLAALGAQAQERDASAATDDAQAAAGEARASAEPAPSDRGIASWYGLGFHGRRTASGERFDMHALTAAHPWLPFGTRVLVQNPANGRSIVVRVNDRGPHTPGRIIDLSHAAARALGLLGWGTKSVVVTPVPGEPRTR